MREKMQWLQSYLWHGYGQFRNFIETTCRILLQAPAKSSALFFFFICLLAGAFFTTRFHDSTIVTGSSAEKAIQTPRTSLTNTTNDPHKHQEVPPQTPGTITNNHELVRNTTDDPKKHQELPSETPGTTTNDHELVTNTTDDPQKHQELSSQTPGTTLVTNTTDDPQKQQQLPSETPETTIVTNTTSDSHKHQELSKIPRNKIEIPLNCTAIEQTRTCPTNYPTTFQQEDPSNSSCPDYFRWIHEDLRPWKATGITRDMVRRAKRTANFRLVILNGKAYLETYSKAFQSRDTFNLWGILQLLRRYPGKVPDLELMFDCNDPPVIKSKHFHWLKVKFPPPLFGYCRDDATLDIVFPDWSFWGWPEINIKPWGPLSKELKESNERTRWLEREDHAFWKGNPETSGNRKDLLKCNVSEKHDWGARVYAQDWVEESQHGFKQSDLASQCIHRYKISIEGGTWSVSEKYILACDSVTLLVKPRFYDIFTRSLEPVHHYWPINEHDKCRSIKFALDWGNNHKEEAQAIGKAASEFILEEAKMDYIYDYMFHLLNEYAKLLKFKPTIPSKAVEICSETMACKSWGLEKSFMMESMEKGPADTGPCNLPPPYDPPALYSLRRRRENTIKEVERWEKNYWKNQKKKKH